MSRGTTSVARAISLGRVESRTEQDNCSRWVDEITKDGLPTVDGSR